MFHANRSNPCGRGELDVRAAADTPGSAAGWRAGDVADVPGGAAGRDADGVASALGGAAGRGAGGVASALGGSGAPLLIARGLSVSYDGVGAVRDASFSVARGSFVGIVGESGAGKSTVLNAIACLLPQAAHVAGSLVFDGANLLDLDEHALQSLRGTRIATIFQNPTRMFDPSMRIGAQLVELIRVHEDASKRAARAKTRALLARMGFSDVDRVFASYPFELSGGMMQRVALAAALAFEPELLLADEPTSALDATTQAAIAQEFTRLNRDGGTTILMVTHNIALAANLCDTLLVMERGRIVEQGPARALVARPRSACARKLVATSPRWEREA